VFIVAKTTRRVLTITTEKGMTIRATVTHGYPKEKLRAETAKCTLLRANCYRKDHYEVSDGAWTVIDEMRDVDE